MPVILSYFLKILCLLAYSSENRYVNTTVGAHKEIDSISEVQSPILPGISDFEVNALLECTTESEAYLFESLAQFYKTDSFIQELLDGSVKQIKTSYGLYTVLNQIVYYVSKDGRYLLYIPKDAIMPGKDITLRQQLIQEAHDVLYS
jgi:hypothetical protein